MTKDLTTPSPSRAALDAFLQKHALQRRNGGRGRLVFSLDATASRKPTWDLATSLTAPMLKAVGGLLDCQLVFYRGLSECKASPWVSDGSELTNLMKRVHCEAGETQIGRILAHARKEDIKQKVQALVFIGDACEENPDVLHIAAKQLGCPAFMFQEGDDPEVTKVFADIARVTGGAHCKFDRSSAKQLAELLSAIAAFVVGGRQALENMSTPGAVKLLQQLK